MQTQSGSSTLVVETYATGAIDTSVSVYSDGEYVTSGDTGADGRVEFNLSAGSYRVEARGTVGGDHVDDTGEVTENVTLSAGESTTTALTFAALVIDTTAADGPVDTATTIRHDGVYVDSTDTGDNGQSVAYLAPGTYEVESRGTVDGDHVDDTGEIRQNVTLSAGVNTTSTFEFATLVVETTAADGPIDAATTIRQGGTYVDSTDSGGDGRFVSYLAPGTYEVEARGTVDGDHVDDTGELTQNVTISAGTSTPAVFSFATLVVETSAADGAVDAATTIRQDGTYVDSTDTGDDGQFVSYLAPGTYEIESRGTVDGDHVDDTGELTQNVTVTAGTSTTEEFVFATLVVETTAADGSIDAATTIRQDRTYVDSADSGGDGQFVSYLAPGTYEVEARGTVGGDHVDDAGEIVRNVTIAAGERTTDAFRFATLSVNATAAAGPVDAAATIRQDDMYVDSADTGSNGHFVAYLAPDGYELSGEYDDSTVTGTVTVNALEEVSALMDFSAGTVSVSDGGASTAETNTPPSADAGSDTVVPSGTSVSLDGSGSTDADGDRLSYTWDQTSGPVVTLAEADSATPTFTAPSVDSETTLTFTLTVSDGDAAVSDTVDVAVEPIDTPTPTETPTEMPTPTVTPTRTPTLTETPTPVPTTAAYTVTPEDTEPDTQTRDLSASRATDSEPAPTTDANPDEEETFGVAGPGLGVTTAVVALLLAAIRIRAAHD